MRKQGGDEGAVHMCEQRHTRTHAHTHTRTHAHTHTRTHAAHAAHAAHTHANTRRHAHAHSVNRGEMGACASVLVWFKCVGDWKRISEQVASCGTFLEDPVGKTPYVPSWPTPPSPSPSFSGPSLHKRGSNAACNLPRTRTHSPASQTRHTPACSQRRYSQSRRDARTRTGRTDRELPTRAGPSKGRKCRRSCERGASGTCERSESERGLIRAEQGESEYRLSERVEARVEATG